MVLCHLGVCWLLVKINWWYICVLYKGAPDPDPDPAGYPVDLADPARIRIIPDPDPAGSKVSGSDMDPDPAWILGRIRPKAWQIYSYMTVSSRLKKRWRWRLSPTTLAASEVLKVTICRTIVMCELVYIVVDTISMSVTATLTMSLVLSKKNLTPTRIPVITMAATTAHVTAMITCFRVTRDFLTTPVFSSNSACKRQNAILSCYSSDRTD